MAETQHHQKVDVETKENSNADVEQDTDLAKTTNMKVYNDSERIEYTEEEGKRVKRRIDRILLPLMCCCYISSVRDAPFRIVSEAKKLTSYV